MATEFFSYWTMGAYRSCDWKTPARTRQAIKKMPTTIIVLPLLGRRGLG